MNEKLSRLLSYVLRHRPDKFGLELAKGGWISVDSVINALRNAGHSVSREDIAQVVETNDKKRFALSEDGTRVRANQGHSLDVELGLQPVSPPERLFHGTIAKALSGIRESGLVPRSRHHVHLSPDVSTATAVGARRGRPIILEVASGAMSEAGLVFYLSENGVWLTDHVPVRYIGFPDGAEE